MFYTMTKEDTQDFARQNKLAVSFLINATNDYVGARCCLSNGLLVGLVLGAQAVEKYLKAFILFKDSSQNIKKLSHKIPELAKKAIELDSNFTLSAQALTFIETLEKHYNSRYPDNSNSSTTKSSAEIDELDEIVMLINEQLDIPMEVRYRNGLYAVVNSSLESNINVGCIIEQWIKTNNKALEPLHSKIKTEYLSVREHLYD